MGSPVAHTAVDNPTALARRAEVDIGAAHKVETDIVPGADYMVAMDTEAETVHRVEADIEAEAVHWIEMDIVDRALMVVNSVAEDWCTDLILPEHTQVDYIDPCLPTCCRNYHKTAHAPHSVYRNLCSTPLLLVELQEHAHHDHTAYKKLYLPQHEHGMPDKQS